MRPGHRNGPATAPVKHLAHRTTAGELRYAAERRYAEGLDAKGLPWIYEPTFFRFAGFRYTPDFFLPIGNLFVEIIGSRQRWAQVRGKLELFRVHFPDIQLLVLGGDGKPWMSQGPRVPNLERAKATELRGVACREAECRRRPRSERPVYSGAKIRAARLSAGLAQTEVARLAGFAQCVVSYVEHGYRQPYPGEIDRLARVLKLRPEELTETAA
jgi:hypothetical protein